MAFNDVFKGKKIIVTGNTGFKGSWLTLWLLRMGAIVTGISKDVPTEPSLFNELKLGEKIDHHFADIRNLAVIEKIFGQVRPDFVFHLAAQPIVSFSYVDPIETFETNVMGTVNVLEALRKMDHSCKAIMITSDKCYDNVEWIWGYREQDALGGKDPYSASKGAAEIVIKTYFHSFFNKPDSKVQLVSVRAGNVIGGGDWALNRIVPDCVRAWDESKAVSIRNPNSTRPWQHVLEPLSGYLRVAQVLQQGAGSGAGMPSINGEPFNFGPNADQNHTVLELLKAINDHWKRHQEGGDFLIEPNQAFHEAGLLKLNCDKALFHLQWRPVLEFPETARFTGAWYDHYYNGAKKDLYQYTMEQIAAYERRAAEKQLSWIL